MRHVEEMAIKAVGKVLNNPSRPLKERFRALFTLRNIGGTCAIENIAKCFSDPSALLKHECAYCLGQMKDPAAIPMLVNILKDLKQEPIVRHEAAEALGAIGSPDSVSILEEFMDDSQAVVSETCKLAIAKIAWLQSEESKAEKFSESPYSSVDPAPPSFEQNTVEEERKRLLDTSRPLFERYRAMFALRNCGSPEAITALAEGLKCPSSALFRHEVAYVLGQAQEEISVPYLKEVLLDTAETAMVRHECAEALGSIATEECFDLLQKYVKDPEVLVRESCQVALDMCEYENSKEFQYANTLLQVQTEALI